MKTDRAISTTARLLVVALSLALPAGASANSLLSGYGGPGQGNQAILGSALVNGPSSGGGSGGSSGSATGSGSSVSSPSATGASETATGRASTRQAHGRSGTSKGRTRARGTSAGGVRAYTSPTVAATPQAAVGGSPALGLSGTDLLYILLALGVLMATGLLTRQVARRPG